MPTAIFYGGKDTVIDVDSLITVLPYCVKLTKVDEYEHLCVIWADSAVKKIFPEVVEVLRKEYAKMGPPHA